MTDPSIAWQASPTGDGEHRPALLHRLVQRLAASLSASIIPVLIVLAGLPIAVWLDLRHLSENALRSQADGLATVIGNVRAYYAANVVGRVLAHSGETQVVGNYQDVPGAIPIPATLSLDLGSVLGDANSTNNMRYRFFSDYPFAKRSPHTFDEFEREALAGFRDKRQTSLYDVSGSIFDRRVRLITPIMMGAGCVNCHNAHPESPKRDWKVGDIRGIEEFSVSQPIAANIFAFRYLLTYFVLVTLIGLTFIGLQRHQASVIAQVNRHLGKTNEFLSTIAQKLAKYLSPQLYAAYSAAGKTS